MFIFFQKIFLFVVLYSLCTSGFAKDAKRGVLYIISGPSGVGKTTLIKSLITEVDYLEQVISYTTRKKRDSEEESVDYHYVQKSDFMDMINNNFFLEYNEILNNYYGISEQDINKALSKGIDLILTVDWQGTRKIKEKLGDKIISIYILPPNLNVLSERLKKRNQDSAQEITKRIKLAINDMSHFCEYDYAVCNDEFEESKQNLKWIILINRLKVIK